MTLYEEVLNLAMTYIGPAAERFVNRQIMGHLNIEKTQLAPQHLEELAKWCYISGKLIMPEAQAQEFGEKVRALRK